MNQLVPILQTSSFTKFGSLACYGSFSWHVQLESFRNTFKITYKYICISDLRSLSHAKFVSKCAPLLWLCQKLLSFQAYLLIQL